MESNSKEKTLDLLSHNNDLSVTLDNLIAYKVMFTRFQDDAVVKGIIKATRAKIDSIKAIDTTNCTVLNLSQIEDDIEAIEMLVTNLSDYLDTHNASEMEDISF